jgi:O-antigen ligase
VIFLYYLDLAPALDEYVRDLSGRFNSLAFLAFDVIGMICVIAVACAMYFATTRRRSFALLAVAMLLPIVATLQKTPIMASLGVVAVSMMFVLPRRFRLVLTLGVGVLLLSETTVYDLSQVQNNINSNFGGAQRGFQDIDDTQQTRVALWLRGLDVFIQNFPYGAGNGLVEEKMQYARPHFTFFLPQRWQSTYEAQATSDRVTNSHNLFSEFMAENGIFGVGVLVAIVLMIGRQFAAFLRTVPNRGDPIAWRVYMAQACMYACMVGMLMRYFYETREKFYFVMLSWLVLSYVMPQFAENSAPPESAPVLGKRTSTTTAASAPARHLTPVNARLQ